MEAVITLFKRIKATRSNTQQEALHPPFIDYQRVNYPGDSSSIGNTFKITPTIITHATTRHHG
ncbi:hypothetical protein E2C01_044168 [Portunus trituberculatus]|uniref:Uncharacterized protein n=1 Tax=Portunus trituberculatus TaxID=210409 RepID=A0A5B7FRD3_PORTR|nr:hypothetical protein [Portunus trituberculatus]